MSEHDSCSRCGLSGNEGCSSGCSSYENLDQFLEEAIIDDQLSKIKHKVLVLSGKGGVGKSTIAVNIATSLALNGKKVGLMDVDIHGPSIPKLLHLENRKPESDGMKINPIVVGENLKVVSIGFLLENDKDAVIWRGPMKYSLIKQFISNVNWGDLDYLIVDCPPGTGDEPLSVVQVLKSADGAIVVTTPQDLSTADVKRSVNFCEQLNLKVIGIVENMSGFICPHCNMQTDIFKSGGGENLAKEMSVPFLGKIPIDPKIVEASDSGQPYVYHFSKTESAKAFENLIQPLLQMDE